MSFEKLFEDWQNEHKFTAFIKDGIVNPETYEKPHILFILRDMNCNEDKDLRKCLSYDGSGWKTWNNIGRWTKALLDGDEEYPYDMSGNNRIEQLKRIAVMNLKKEGGTARTNGNELLEVVKTQKDFIMQEITLCQPDIIICCGLTSAGITGNDVLLKDNVFEGSTDWQNFNSESLNRKWWYYKTSINEKQIPVIGFCHPQVTHLGKNRGHEQLFKPLYRDMLLIRKLFISQKGKK